MRKFGRYQIQAEVGRGGMAVVYRAHDSTAGRDVAIKVLPPSFSSDQDALARFQREIGIALRLEHVHIVPIFDVGVEEEQPFIVMRLLTGGSLLERIRQRPLLPREALPVLAQVGQALDAAHALGIVHRDLKPSNILFDQHSVAFLSDFGIARAVDATQQLTVAGVMGTPAYMSPEQLRGETLDGRTDLYALGAVAFEALTGRLPYEGNTTQIISQHLAAPVPNCIRLNPDLPSPIQAVLERAMAKRAQDRYASAADLVAALQHASLNGNAQAQAPDWHALPVTHDDHPPTPPKPMETLIKQPADYVARLYSDGRKALDRRDWAIAQMFFEKISVLQPDYRDAARLLDLARQGGAESAGVSGWAGAADETLLPPARTAASWPAEHATEYMQPPPVQPDTGALLRQATPPQPEWAAQQARPPEPLAARRNTPADQRAPVGRQSKSAAPAQGGHGASQVNPRRARPWRLVALYGGGFMCLLLSCIALISGLLLLSPREHQVAFASGRTGNYEVYVIDPDRPGAVINLTNHTAFDADPAWSPDGENIAFYSDRSGVPEIYVMDSYGQNVRQLTFDNAVAVHADWSPDGKQIAYASNVSGNFEVYVMTSSGSEVKQITTHEAADYTPKWSPKGDRIAFITSRHDSLEGTGELYVMNTNGGELARLLSNNLNVQRFNWTPDGERLVLGAKPDGESQFQIYVVNANGTGLQRLTNGSGDASFPSMSPDDKRIVFTLSANSRNNLYMMSADGTGSIQLTDTEGDNTVAAWRPQGLFRWPLR